MIFRLLTIDGLSANSIRLFSRLSKYAMRLHSSDWRISESWNIQNEKQEQTRPNYFPLTCWHLNKRLNVSHEVAVSSLLFSMHFFNEFIHSV